MIGNMNRIASEANDKADEANRIAQIANRRFIYSLVISIVAILVLSIPFIVSLIRCSP